MAKRVSLDQDVDERRSKWSGYSSEKDRENGANFAKHAKTPRGQEAKSGALAELKISLIRPQHSLPIAWS